MPKLIKILKDRQVQVTTDEWQFLQQTEKYQPQAADQQPLLVPMKDWLEQPNNWSEYSAKLGVWLAPDDAPDQIQQHLHHFDVLAIHFPNFTDGRGYTSARLLRQRYDYDGELRAIGEVLCDQLFYLMRCGFDSFALRDDQDTQDCITALSAFDYSYQDAVDNLNPLFRRYHLS